MKACLSAAPWMVGLVAGMAGLSPAEGALITFEFGGQVTSIDDPQGLLQGLVEVGQAYSGLYTFDSASPDMSADNSEVGRYACVRGGTDVTLGNLMISPEDSHVYVGNHTRGDIYGLSAGPTTSGDLTVSEFGFQLRENTGGVFPDDALPLVPPELNQFSFRSFGLMAGPVTGLEFTIIGNVTYLVPEPGSFLFLMTGAVSLMMRRSRPDRRADSARRRSCTA